jgi:glycosyltransferase involved in cell wall biosynthesis
MPSVLLTIAIPTWNRSAILKEALVNLLSIFEQYPNEIELVVSDNNSDDDTEAVIKAFNLNHPLSSFKFNKNKSNIGFYGNFKRCKELATGEYIWLLSDDDHFTLSAMKLAIETLINDKPEVIYFNKNEQVALTSEKVTNNYLIDTYKRGLTLISSCIFKNEFNSAERLHLEYEFNPFIGFMYLLNSMTFNESNTIIISGNSYIGTKAIPTGYNYFDVFINGIQPSLNLMKSKGVRKEILMNFRNHYLLQFLLPLIIKYRIEKNLSFVNCELADVKQINSWVKKYFSDLFSYKVIYLPLSLIPDSILHVSYSLFKKIK